MQAQQHAAFFNGDLADNPGTAAPSDHISIANSSIGERLDV